ncbi:MAG: glycosyltransferase family 29 protein [Akkermansiaceae bacterium]
MRTGFKNKKRGFIILRYMPWPLLLQLGYMRRKSGKYDKNTYACFYGAWVKRPCLGNLVAYLSFRRDLGLALPKRFKETLKQILPSASIRKQHKIINWLIEADPSTIFASSCLPVIEKLVDRSPAVAAYIQKKNDADLIPAQPLAILQYKQEKWREEFIDWIRCNKHSICVVGNSAEMEGQERGDLIDHHDLVIRFNQYAHCNCGTLHDSYEQIKDSGSKINIWVRSPGYSGPAPATAESADWIIIAGPDVRYQLSDWAGLESIMLNKQKVITVPLSVWRKSVSELQAPPSAGILIVAWLIEILDREHSVKATGFQIQGAKEIRYHRILPRHKASMRHNWRREADLLRLWHKNGELTLI